MRSRFRPSAILFFLVSVTVTLGADDSTRALQEALRREGFYLGEPDGLLGEETRSAIRRFQIRNGLEVTGEPDAATRAALGLDAAERDVPSAEATRSDLPSPTPVQPPPSDAGPRTEDASRTPRRSATLDEERTRAVPALAALFRDTVYATAPVVVRVDVLRTAQSKLRALGLYDGEIDGLPGPATARAIAAYQRRCRIPEIGRLDMDTLYLLGLLPSVIPPPAWRGRPPRLVPPPMRPPHVPPALW